jgi:hypothetical protein
MDDLDTQIAQVQARLTSAVRNGEPEDSPQLRQMGARLERMRRLWATHRQIRLGLQTNESTYGSHAN